MSNEDIYNENPLFGKEKVYFNDSIEVEEEERVSRNLISRISHTLRSFYNDSFKRRSTIFNANKILFHSEPQLKAVKTKLFCRTGFYLDVDNESGNGKIHGVTLAQLNEKMKIIKGKLLMNFDVREKTIGIDPFGKH